MRRLVADLFVSLDGFAAGDNTEAFFGFPGPELERWVAGQLAEPQVIVMGRVTYEAMARVAGAAEDPGSRQMSALPKLVFSNTLGSAGGWPNTEVMAGDAVAGMRTLKEQPGPPLRSIGSLSLVRSLVAGGLVDRLRLMVFPRLLGRVGREPAFEGYAQTRLELLASTVLDSRLVLLEYRPLVGSARRSGPRA